MNKISALLLAGLLALGLRGHSQSDPLSSQYYNNRYLSNPAMAGAGEGLSVNGAYRKVFNSFPGSPVSQNLSGDYGFGKVGIGLNLLNESAGLLGRTRVVGSYAYHLPLGSNGQRLDMGLSMGFATLRLDNSQIAGSSNDASVANFGQRRTYADGDFGLAYSAGGLTLQGALPNLRTLFRRDDIQESDLSQFYTAASYRIGISQGAEGLMLEPMVAYRGVKGFGNIFDAGAQLYLADQKAFVTGLYHSSSSATFGMGMNFQKRYLVSGMYTTSTSQLGGYSNGNFELNLRVQLPK